MDQDSGAGRRGGARALVVTPPAPPDPHIGEGAFQRLITDLAAWCGWWVKVDGDSRRTRAGWPDVFAIKPGRVVAMEIKTKRGRVKPDQRRVGALLATIPGVTYRLVRPRDWPWVVETLIADFTHHDCGAGVDGGRGGGKGGVTCAR